MICDLHSLENSSKERSLMFQTVMDLAMKFADKLPEPEFYPVIYIYIYIIQFFHHNKMIFHFFNCSFLFFIHFLF